MMTGTETTALAIRVARAATGREKIIKFRGHFHGVHDAVVSGVKDPFELPMTAGVPQGTLATTLVARHNDLAHVRELMDEHEVAAVILEPAAARSMVVPTDPTFLRGLRELTRARDVVLIFDEVVTGFRLAPGGAQEFFGVTADLTCLAKAVAGGLPGAALTGRADLMDGIAFSGDARRDRTRRVADQGTYSATPLIAAAGVAALEILRTGDVQRELNRKGDRLRAGMNQVLKTRGSAAASMAPRRSSDLPRRRRPGAGRHGLPDGRGAARPRHGPGRQPAPPGDAARRRRLQPRVGDRMAQRGHDRRGHRRDDRSIRSVARPASGEDRRLG